MWLSLSPLNLDQEGTCKHSLLASRRQVRQGLAGPVSRVGRFGVGMVGLWCGLAPLKGERGGCPIQVWAGCPVPVWAGWKVINNRVRDIKPVPFWGCGEWLGFPSLQAFIRSD